MVRIPRPEHPKPQFFRPSWLNLNGVWSYEFDFGDSGSERDLGAATGFAKTINVPFCPESKLSGVEHVDFIPAIWYHRKIKIPADWQGRDILLHCGAVDYESAVYLDGKFVGRHFGGSVSFSHLLSDHVSPGGEHDLVIHARDNTRDMTQPTGKQSKLYASHGCRYTRVTGIWQTVWLEAVDRCGLKEAQLTPDFDQGALVVTPQYRALGEGYKFAVSILAAGEEVARQVFPQTPGVAQRLVIPQPRAWSPADPFLYDLKLQVLDAADKLVDEVESYFGLRKVHCAGQQVYLNNEPIYQRLVLDQGYYPDGIWTAPSDAALKQDIELALQAGFNGARLHQKVFEERFHYWADKLGYLTWGESGSMGCDHNQPVGARNFLAEWQEIVTRDRNHPSIIVWTPWNETDRFSNPKEHWRTHIDTYDLTKSLDPTRPVNTASGYLRVKTDLWTDHNYAQDADNLQKALQSETPAHKPDKEIAYAGQPYLLDEFGGIKWIPEARQAYAADSWGYGNNDPESEEEFFARLTSLVAVVLRQKNMCGYCYTQLTDVEQEQNGIYNYDRTLKFPLEKVHEIFSQDKSSSL